MICSLSAYASVQTDPADGVSPLRYNGLLSFSAPLTIPLRVTSGFGQRFHPVTLHYAGHNGTDFAAPLYSPVLAVESGQVTKLGSDPISGRYLVIKHQNGWVSKYLHLSVFDVRLNQRVEKGHVIALSGASGRTTGPHLHLEISYRGQLLDPALVFSPSPYRRNVQVPLPKKDRIKKEPAVPEGPRIVFIVQREGKPRIGIKKGNKLVYAKPGDKVFNEFRVVSTGKRYSLQRSGH